MDHQDFFLAKGMVDRVCGIHAYGGVSNNPCGVCARAAMCESTHETKDDENM